MNMHTPWGNAQTVDTIAEGIIHVTTASHGGIILSPERLAEMPAEYRKGCAAYCPLNAFEEDFEVCLVIASFPQHFKAEDVEDAKRSIERSSGYWR